MITDPAQSTGFLRQAFGTAEYLGSTAVVATVTVVAYVVGLLGVAVGGIARHLALLASRPFAWAIWILRQQLAIRRHRQYLRATLATATGGNSEGATKMLQTIENHQRLLGLWITRSEVIQRHVGVPFGKHTDHTESQEQIRHSINDAFLKAFDGELSARGMSTAANQSLPSYRVRDLTDAVFAGVFERDPLDFLRAVDDGLYDAFDRERSEREFRLAVMPPVVGFGISLAVGATAWAWIAVVFAGMTFIQSAAVQSQERRRVLDHVVLRGLPKTVLEAAEVHGRLAARRLMDERTTQAVKEARTATEQTLRL